MNHILSKLIPVLCLFLLGCTTSIPEDMKTAERLMETSPDSALQILQHLSPSTYKSESNRALYGLLYIRALDKNMLPLKPDSLLDFSIEYYQNHADPDRLATCYLYKGRAYNYGLQYEKAIGSYLQALDELDNEQNQLLLGRIYSDLADIYNIQNDHALARQKYRLALAYFTKAKLQSQTFYCLLNIGRTFNSAKDYKNAQLNYSKLFSQARDSMQQGALLQEIALNYYDNKKFDSALVYCRRLIHYPYIGNNKSIRYYYLANVYFDLNQIDSANLYAKKSFLFEPEIRTQRECYRILANTEYLKGNEKETAAYMNKYVVLGDSLRKIDAQTKGSYIESMHNTKKEISKTQSKLWYMLGFIILLISVTFLFYCRLKKRIKTEKRLLKSENIHLETENIVLETEKTRLESEKIQTEQTHTKQKAGIRIDIMLKLGDTLSKKVEAIKVEQILERKNASYAQKELLDRKIYEELLHFNDGNIFYSEMDTVLNNLVSKLKLRYTGLTDKEITWCCLFLLNVTVPDMLMLLNYKSDSLNKMKQRVARKTNLSSAFELKNFLLNIVSEI